MELKFIIEEEHLTINQVLKNKLHISSRLFNKLIKNGFITVNGFQCDTRNKANIGDIIKIKFDYNEDNSNIISKNIPLNIIYEDEWFIILNKPCGIAVHPSILHYEDSLSNGLKFYFDEINLHKKIRPVNRLDRNTAVLIIFAKNEYIQECFVRQMADNIFKKEYLAIVCGILKDKKRNYQ